MSVTERPASAAFNAPQRPMTPPPTTRISAEDGSEPEGELSAEAMENIPREDMLERVDGDMPYPLDFGDHFVSAAIGGRHATEPHAVGRHEQHYAVRTPKSDASSVVASTPCRISLPSFVSI